VTARIRAKLQWRALQLRQVQRLATEALFGWIERCIWHNGAHTAPDFDELMTQAIQRWSPGLSADRISVALSLLSECGKLLRVAGPDGNVIQMLLGLKQVFRLPLRALQGFAGRA